MIRKYTSLAWLVRKAEGRLLRRVIVDAVSQSGRSQENVQKPGKSVVAADTHEGPRIRKHITSPRIFRRTLVPKFQAILDRVKDDANRDKNKEARAVIKIGHRRIPLDPTFLSRNPPRHVHKPEESKLAAYPQESLDDVLDAFENLFNRLGKDSANPVGGLRVGSSRSTKPNSTMRHTRSYTTSTVGELDLAQTLLSGLIS